jgi:hypothetical protein
MGFSRSSSIQNALEDALLTSACLRRIIARLPAPTILLKKTAKNFSKSSTTATLGPVGSSRAVAATLTAPAPAGSKNTPPPPKRKNAASAITNYELD